ncbi:MAG: hypothetical protein IPM29_07790 [Planctomycetes bacterium]|nr:hypothetical protein [Planctomycetota bacterium]
MTDLPLHPLVVHLPVALAALMPVLTVALLVAWRTGFLPRRTWTLAVALQAVLLLGGLGAAAAGEDDAERIEGAVAEAAIEAHEEAADLFLWGAGAVLALAAATLFVRREGAARTLAALTVVGSLGVLFLGYRVGHAGGELVYRHGAASALSAAPSGPAGGAAAERDDDD